MPIDVRELVSCPANIYWFLNQYLEFSFVHIKSILDDKSVIKVTCIKMHKHNCTLKYGLKKKSGQPEDKIYFNDYF